MQQFGKGVEKYLIVVVLTILAGTSWAYELEGTTQWYQRIELSPLSSGTVQEVLVGVGGRVKQGALLLQMEQEFERIQLQQAQQRLKQAELLYAEAQRENERVEDLYERTLISDHDRALGEAAWEGAIADLYAAKMALASARREQGQRELRAPFNAIIIVRQAEPGTLANHQLSQSPLLTIASSTSMAVEGYLTATQSAQIRKQPTLQVEVAGKSHPARVESVALEPATTMQGKYRVRLLIPYSEGLRAGMKAVISVD